MQISMSSNEHCFYTGRKKQCREAAAISVPLLLPRGIELPLHFKGRMLVHSIDGRQNICLPLLTVSAYCLLSDIQRTNHRSTGAFSKEPHGKFSNCPSFDVFPGSPNCLARPHLATNYGLFTQIREDTKTGVYVEGLTEEYVSNMDDVTSLLVRVCFEPLFIPLMLFLFPS
jgi:hypothetical protein